MADKHAVTTTSAPRAVGPYSQAIVADGWVFVSGQIPLIPETGVLIQGDVAEQTRQVLVNLAAVLQASGSSIQHVVKVTVYLADMADFGVVNGVYGSYFTGDSPPARATVQVAALPLGAHVEMDAIAQVRR